MHQKWEAVPHSYGERVGRDIYRERDKGNGGSIFVGRACRYYTESLKGRRAGWMEQERERGRSARIEN